MGLADALHRCKTDWRLLVPLLVLNLVGLVFGYYYYADVGQFDVSHLTCGDGATDDCEAWWMWPLVADSPNAVLLFMVAALAYRLTGWRSKTLDAFAFLLNVYVGLWTTFLFLAYSDRMGTFDYGDVADGNANPVLFIAHMGMPLQAFVLAKDMRKDTWRLRYVAIVLVAVAAYVAVDYWGPTLHPAPFLHDDSVTDSFVGLEGDALLHLGSPWLMALAALAWVGVIGARPSGKPATSTGGTPDRPTGRAP